MQWFKMCVIACRLAWPFFLTPWRSPLLRWRMETYGILDARGVPVTAHEITAPVFFHFLLTKRVALVRFLRWAATLDRLPAVTSHQPMLRRKPRAGNA